MYLLCLVLLALPVPAQSPYAYTCDSEAALTLADSLAKDAAVEQLDCAATGERLAAQNRVLERFAAVAASRQGAMRLRKVCPTVEGDPIVHYLVVADGEVLFVTDSRADRFGPKRVCGARVASVELGYLVEQEGLEGGPRFVRGVAGAPEGARFILRCAPHDWDF
jgi:hypothetical protein